MSYYTTNTYMRYIHEFSKQLVEYSTVFLHSLFLKPNPLVCFVLKQGLTRQSSLALNTCYLPKLCHHAWLQSKHVLLALFRQHSFSHLHSITVLLLICAGNSNTIFNCAPPSAISQFLLACLLFSSHITRDCAQSVLSDASTRHC